MHSLRLHCATSAEVYMARNAQIVAHTEFAQTVDIEIFKEAALTLIGVHASKADLGWQESFVIGNTRDQAQSLERGFKTGADLRVFVRQGRVESDGLAKIRTALISV